MLQHSKDEMLELEDYVQGLNDRFELPGDQLMTPRCSFEGTIPDLSDWQTFLGDGFLLL